MLSAKNLKFSYGRKLIFDQLSLSLLTGERVALVGENGAGKSTLLKLLVGQLEPDSGSIDKALGARIGFLMQEPQIDPNLSVWAELRKNFKGEDFHIETLLSRLKIKAREQSIESLSGGERRRVDLARVLLEEPDIFLLDEPTNHLDLEAISFLVDYFKSTSKPLLFISHDSSFIDEVANRIIEIDSAKLYSHRGSYSDFVENKLARIDIEQRTLHRKDRLMARELAWLRSGTPARTTKQQARISRAQELIQEVASEFDRTQKKQVQIDSTRNKRLAKTIIELKNLAFEPLFQNFNLLVSEGQRFGILGPNGCGKTTLLSLVSGVRQPSSGEVIRGPHTQIIQFDQNRAELNPELSLRETLADQGDTVFVQEKSIHIASYLERYLFQPSEQNRKVETLSGGERNRLLLAKQMKYGGNCLLLDEPTNDLDAATLGVLEERLNTHDGVAFIVSHDRRFLDRVCNQMLIFEESSIVQYPGNYSTYLSLRSALPIISRNDKIIHTSVAKIREKKKRSYQEEREYGAIEAKILEVEKRKENVEFILSDPSKYAEYSECMRELGILEAKIQELYERWQYLENLS